MQRMIAGLLLAGLIAGANVLAADEPKEKKDKAPAAPAPLDAKAAEEMKKSLQGALEQPLPKLTAAARKLAREVSASLRYDRGIAQLRARESLLEEARVEALTLVQSTAKERKELREQLEKERAAVRQQYKDDAKTAEQEEVVIIEMYLPNMQSLKAQEEKLNKLIKDTSAELARVRLTLRSLEREKSLAEKGLGAGMEMPTLPELKLGDGAAPEKTGPAPKRTLKEVQDLLKDL